MTTALLTPYAHGRAVELGKRMWRKQILKFGQITYGGRPIDFTPDYARDLIDAHKNGVIDQVPFQLADYANRHTNDPERTRGVIKGYELTPDGTGLDAFVETSDEGSKVIENNPDLGVSARILEDVEYADGRKAGRVIQHVLGTLDPHLSGMRPWQAVTLSSNSDAPVVDLTAATYRTEKEATMAALTEDEVARVREFLAENQNTSTEGDDAQADTGDDATDDELTDEELAALLEELDAEGDDSAPAAADTDGGSSTEDQDADTSGEPVAAALANQKVALDLANAQGEQNALELAQVRDQLDDATYASERDTIARDSGIPPRIVDLAKPLLKGNGHTVELASGDQVDAGQIVRQVFTELGQLVKVLDLSGEIGHAVDLTRTEEEKAEADERDEFVKNARSQFGL